jgi:SWI/SNF-related matrix-associated actin-dependent regulator of chromatin subfamily A3
MEWLVASQFSYQDFALHMTDQLAKQIYRVAARVGGSMLEMDTKLKKNFNYPNHDPCTFGIRQKPDQMALHFPDGTDFGVLNTHTSKGLEDLIQRPDLQFEVIGSIRAILDTIGRVTKAADAVIRVNINVYGPRESSKEVGNHLTSHKLYLQRPDVLRTGSKYENPHLLTFLDMQISSFENQLDVGSIRAPKLDDTQKFRETISNVYSSLTRGANLNKVEGDHRLKTALLP